MKRFLLINPRSGNGGPRAGELARAAAALGVETHLFRPGEDDAGELILRSGVGVAGGDGSLAPVAQAAIEIGAALVCVPFGTRNHFARDIGLERTDPLGALDAFAGGVERRIDVGRVGDRLFLNNVSFGTYAHLVHRRERHRRRGEALARARALSAVARRRGHLHARVNGEEIDARVLFVGNNRYEISLLTLGERARLDEGALALRAAAGLLPGTWQEQVAARFTIELPSRTVRAASDGEPLELASPIELESLPRALRLLLPETPAGPPQ